MKYWLSFILALSLATTFSNESCAKTQWEFAGWYGGGCYPNVEFDPHVRGRVYLTSDVAGIWRSDDLGENWKFITSGLGNLNVPLIVSAPSEPQKMYAGTGNGVFVSQDSGQTWSPTDDAKGQLRFSRPESHRAIVVSQTDGARVIAGTVLGKIFYSEDSGKKWKLLGDREPFGKKTIITAMVWLEKEAVLYAASDQGLARFLFDTSRWESFPGSPKDITDLHINPQSPQTLYAGGQNRLFTTHDGGHHWNAGGGIPNGVLFRLLPVPHEEKTWLAAWNDGWKGGVVRSADDGQTWIPWEREMNGDAVSNPTRAWAGVHGRLNALKSDPFDPRVLFRTDWWGVWRSDDGGATWTEKIKGSPNTITADIAISDQGEIYVATMDNGLLKSGDGGDTYQPLFPVKGYAKDINGHVWRVRVLGKTVMATSSPWDSEFDQVLISRDGGKNFKRSRQGLPDRRSKVNTVWHRGFTRALAVSPKRPETVYLGADGNDRGGFFVSKDGGKTWQKPKNQPGSLKIYNGLAVDPEAPDRVLWGASGKNGGLYLSENGGESWTHVDSRMESVFDVAFGTGGRAYAAGDQKGAVIYGSQNGGKSWSLLKKFDDKGSVKGLHVLPDGRVATGVVYWHGTAGGKVYLSSPDGKEWEDITGDLPHGDGPSSLAYDEKKKVLYLARYAGNIYKTDLGAFHEN